MKFVKVLLLFLAGISILLANNPRRVVLLEEATNASCSPCAAANPQIQDFLSHHFGGAISVRYHAWWPGTDPMYNQNVADNTTRIQYYGINGVPNYMIDGKNMGVPSSSATITQQMNDRLSLESPLAVNVAQWLDGDSVRITVDVTAFEAFSVPDARVRVALIERRVTYDSAPGSNGETEFGDVMRVMLPDGLGTLLGDLAQGNSYHAEYAVAKASHWVAEKLAAVAFVQDDATREVINAAISIPTFVIESKDFQVDLLSLNSTVEKNYFIANSSDSILNVTVSLEDIALPADWDLAFADSRKSFNGSVSAGDTAEFTVVITCGSASGSAEYRLFALNTSDPLAYGYATEYYGTVQNGDILIVDDDGGAAHQALYETALGTLGRDYTVITEAAMMQIPDQIKPEDYRTVFWNIGWASPALTVKDVAFLKDYLDHGGSLFISGQDLAWDNFSSQGASFSIENQMFFKEYLGAVYVKDNSGIYSYSGAAGDIIGDGLSFDLNSVYTKYPDEIKAIHEGTKAVFYFQGTQKVGGVRLENGVYHTVYLGFSLEQISDESIRTTIIERSLAFFDSSSFRAVPGDVSMNGAADSTDAQWMLNYRIGNAEFYGVQRGNANVTADTTISALDAAMVLRYVAGDISSLPVDFSAETYPTGGTPTFSAASDVAKRDTLFVDFRFDNAQNILAMEGIFEYAYPSIIMMTYSWYDSVKDHFIVNEKSVDGRFHFALAAGEFQSLGQNKLLRLQFIVNPSTILDSVDVRLTSLRVNEEEVMYDACALETNIVSIAGNENIPEKFRLYANYPNPFNPSTTIRFDLPQQDVVVAEIFNLKGENVQTITRSLMAAGTHELIWNGRFANGCQAPSGIYTCVLRGSQFTASQKMVLLR